MSLFLVFRLFFAFCYLVYVLLVFAVARVVRLAVQLPALMVCAHFSCVCVWLCICRPVMDGLTATTNIREAERTMASVAHDTTPYEPIKIIAITAGAQDDEILACRAAGMNDVVIKPVPRHQLLSKLATVRPRLLSPEPRAISTPSSASMSASR